MIKQIVNFVKYTGTAGLSEEEQYLSQATSLADLERRQKQLMYGSAPHQQQYKMHLTSCYTSVGSNTK